jgi:hypothetical protein
MVTCYAAWSVLLLAAAQARDRVPYPQLRQDEFQSDVVGPASKLVNPSRYQKVLFVAPGGAGQGSREAPLASPAAALASLQNAGASGRWAVLVAAGTYPTVDLKMKPYVDLFGGFDAKDWSRDIVKHKTVLDAGKKGRVLIGADEARLDGFTITGGRARSHGGALLCRDASPTLTNNIFVANGTRMPEDYDLSKRLEIGNCGGAICIQFNSAAIVANNIFANNSTEIGDGGAIYCYEAMRLGKQAVQPQIRNNIFLANRTGLLDPKSKTIANNGGAIACSHAAMPAITGNVMVGNLLDEGSRSNSGSGGSDGGAIHCEYAAKPLIRNNRFVGNGAGDDGSCLCMRSMAEPIVDGNLFAGNWCAGGGSGGVRLNKEGRAILTNNLFAHNQTGGGICCTNSWMTCVNNTIVDNGRGGIIYKNVHSYFGPSIIRGNVIHGNESGSIDIAKKAKGILPEVSHNSVAGGFPGEGNIAVKPKFIDDGIKGKIAGARTAEFTTLLQVEGVSLQPNKLAGRVIRVGDKWSVIKENDATRLTVWGNMDTDREGKGSNAASKFMIIPTYTQTADSPVRNMGVGAGDVVDSRKGGKS